MQCVSLYSSVEHWLVLSSFKSVSYALSLCMSTPLSGCTCLLRPASISAGSVLVRQGVADTEKAAYSSTSLLGAGWAGW